MKLKKLIITGILVMTMCVSCGTAGQTASESTKEQEAQQEQEAPAEQAQTETAGSPAEFLFGEGGPLSGILPEGTTVEDVEEMFDAAKEQIGGANQEISGVIEDIYEKVRSESGNLNEDALKEYANALMERLMGGGEYDDDFFDSLDAYIEIYGGITDAENEYFKEYYDASIDSGEVQIFSNNNLYEEDIEQEEFRMMRFIIQNNYVMDEENQLRYVSSAENVILFTHQKEEDGSYSIKDAKFAEEGDNFTASVEAMYNEVGEPFEEWQESYELAEIFVLYDLETYLNEHPEIKGIEYEGEVRTEEELHQLWNDRLDALYPNGEEGEQTEDAASGNTSESAADAATSEAAAAKE
ncbi:MAG: hypothetical protein Q4D81_03300 [Eubacteriales bacterium]|nr:hypothetical protein [Eubacteriales bacterium]